MSLKSEIENTIAEAISQVAGADSPEVDTDLAPENRLGSRTRGGSYPFDQEMAQGPFATVMIESHTTEQEEFGDLDNRVSILTFNIGVVGLTRLCGSPIEAGQAAADTEELIRLHLQNLKFNIETAYQGGRSSYASILKYLGSSYENMTMSGRQTAPVTEAPAPVAGSNSEAFELLVNPNQAFSGLSDILYTIKVVTPNTVPGSLDGLTYSFSENGSAFSGPIPAATGWNPLSYNLAVQFAPAANVTILAQADDSWTMQARTSQMNFIGIWSQMWQMTAEAIAVM